MLKLAYSLADQNVSTTASIGIYNVSLGLLGALSQRAEADDIKLSVFANKTIPQSDKHDKIQYVHRDYAIARKWQRIIWDQFGVDCAAREVDADWLFLPKGFAPIVRKPKCFLAVYIHDIIPVFYADKYLGKSSRLKQLYFKKTYKATLQNADIVFTNTSFTKQEIERWADEQHLPRPNVMAVGYGFNPVGQVFAKKQQVMLMVRRDPHKRADLAVSFMSRWQKEVDYGGEIVCLGSLPPDVEFPNVASWSLRSNVADEDRETMMGESQAVVHFSEYEGFGMPPVESVIAGTPSVFSDVPPAVEAMGEAGFSFSNDSYESFRLAMDQALNVKQDQVDLWAEQLLARHNWSVVSGRVVTALKKLSD